MDQDSDEEVLSDDTGYVNSSEHDTDHAEKFVPSPEIHWTAVLNIAWSSATIQQVL